MRSESLVRLDADDYQPNKDAERAEIARQTQEYLAKGGKIEQVPMWEVQNAYDPFAKSKEYYTVSQVGAVLNRAPRTVYALIRDKGFPQPVAQADQRIYTTNKIKVSLWCPVEVHKWMDETGHKQEKWAERGN